MKRVNIIYDTMIIRDTSEYETCIDLDVADNVADHWLKGSKAGFPELEKLLTAAEYLKGRIYIKKSIKHIMLADEE